VKKFLIRFHSKSDIKTSLYDLFVFSENSQNAIMLAKSYVRSEFIQLDESNVSAVDYGYSEIEGVLTIFDK
jgi:hypothetical protein